MITTRWTPEFIAQVTALAARGYSAKQVAGMTSMRVQTLTQQCSARKISFQRMPASRRPRVNPEPVPSPEDTMAGDDRMRQLARADLARQIALARAEAATAPIYRGGDWT
jgi:hypothetical protein